MTEAVTHQHQRITDAARESLLADLNRIATKCEHDADTAQAEAVELQQQIATLHADEAFKRAKATAAREAMTRMHSPGTHPTSPRQRANELIALARAFNDDAPGDNARFAELAEAVRVHDALASGDLHWEVQYPDLKGCIAPRDVALQQADEEVRDLVWHIVLPDEAPCVDCRKLREWWTPAVTTDPGEAARCAYHKERYALDARASAGNVTVLGRSA